MKTYRAVNESKIAEPSLSQFFKEHGVQIFTKDAAQDSDKVFESMKIYIERVSTVFSK